MKNLIIFSPFHESDSQASSIRIRYFLNVLSQDNATEHIFGYLNSNLLFSLASNKDHFIKRLISEILIGLELSIRFVFKKCDLYILSSPPFISNMIIGYSLILRRKKYYLDIRDIYPEVYFHLGLVSENSLIGKTLKILVKLLYKKSEGACCVTEGLKNIISNYIENEKIKIIYNGFDENIFFIDNKFEKFTLIFHGNLSRMQNISLLIDLADNLNDEVDLIVIGDGPEANRVRNNPKIKYLGSLDNAEVAKYVRRAHVGLSFRNDGVINETAFPVKVFEYMGCGIPTIITPISEAGHFIEENNMGKQFQNNELHKILGSIKLFKEQKYAYKIPYSFSRNSLADEFKKEISKFI